MHFSRSIPLATTITEMTDLNNRIWDGGPQMMESMLLIASINALCAEFPYLMSQFMTLLTNSTLTLEYIMDHLAVETQSMASVLLAPTVMVTTSSTNPFQRKPCIIDVCMNKANCGEMDYTIETCIQQGGGMAGYTLDEAKCYGQSFSSPTSGFFSCSFSFSEPSYW